MEEDLKKKGYSQQQINKMTPEKAWENLKKPGEPPGGKTATPKTPSRQQKKSKRLSKKKHGGKSSL